MEKRFFSKGEKMKDFLRHNEKAWNIKVAQGNVWTVPVGAEAAAAAREGRFSVLLTPEKPVPSEWFGDLRGKKVLALASGGGQQAPLFAAAGADVVVFDNSQAQLKQDETVARREGLTLRTERGDMRDLSRFGDEGFDLIFHPVSNCFIDDVNAVWQECFRVLKNGGRLLAGFANPLVYIFDFKDWDEHQKLTVRYKIPYADTEQLPRGELEERIQANEALEFGHSLEDQIGGQLRAGFVLTAMYEDFSGGDLLDEHIPSFMATLAVKPNGTRR